MIERRAGNRLRTPRRRCSDLRHEDYSQAPLAVNPRYCDCLGQTGPVVKSVRKQHRRPGSRFVRQPDGCDQHPNRRRPQATGEFPRPNRDDRYRPRLQNEARLRAAFARGSRYRSARAQEAICVKSGARWQSLSETPQPSGSQSVPRFITRLRRAGQESRVLKAVRIAQLLSRDCVCTRFIWVSEARTAVKPYLIISRS